MQTHVLLLQKGDNSTVLNSMAKSSRFIMQKALEIHVIHTNLLN